MPRMVGNQPKRVFLHCSATPNGKHISIRDIDKWHRDRGWDGIGYHYVIYTDGVIQRGREDFEIGAHVKGQNKNSLGVCLIGTDRFSNAQVNALCKLYIGINQKYAIPANRWYGHNEFSTKECPGMEMNVVRQMLHLVRLDHYVI